MPDKLDVIARKFVALATKYAGGWKEVKALPANELKVLFDTVKAAGFEPKKIIPGKLTGDYCEQDGSPTGKTYDVNGTCRFKIICEEGVNYHATGWLDTMVWVMSTGGHRYEEGSPVEQTKREILRSVPLEPVQITVDGGLLREYPPSIQMSYLVDHDRDEDELGDCAGVHMYCGSWVDRQRATKTHDALVCRGCHLRVLFPKKVRTYGELRQALAPQFVQQTSA